MWHRAALRDILCEIGLRGGGLVIGRRERKANVESGDAAQATDSRKPTNGPSERGCVCVCGTGAWDGERVPASERASERERERALVADVCRQPRHSFWAALLATTTYRTSRTEYGEDYKRTIITDEKSFVAS